MIPVDQLIQESLLANQNLIMYNGIVHVLEIVGAVIALNVVLVLIWRYTGGR